MNPALHTKSGRFAYYMHDASSGFRFQLTGDLSVERSQDLEQARLTASSVIGRRDLIVDLTGLTSVDASGRELLKAWQALGAQMTVVSAQGQARIQWIDRPPHHRCGTEAESFQMAAPAGGGTIGGNAVGAAIGGNCCGRPLHAGCPQAAAECRHDGKGHYAGTCLLLAAYPRRHAVTNITKPRERKGSVCLMRIVRIRVHEEISSGR